MVARPGRGQAGPDEVNHSNYMQAKKQTREAVGKEIERKFLVNGNDWRTAKGTKYRQGYLNTDHKRTVRVRTKADKGYLTIKGANRGLTRLEFEYEIPVQDADELLDNLCEKPLIEKNRYEVEYDGLTWEIDEFFGENQGLVIAEVELQSEGQEFKNPEWLGKDVTGDARYYNANLVKHPFTEWKR